MKDLLMVALLAVLLISANKKTASGKLHYLPLGDSYTICTGTSNEKESWPYLLTQELSKKGHLTELLPNPARNGYSTQQLIDEELPLVKKYKPEIVTLLIGVNDWVRNVTAVNFEKNLNTIIKQVQAQLTNKRCIVLITIPDFGVTPQGKYYGGGRNISAGINEFNNIIKKTAKNFNLECADIFELSKNMENDASLVAADGLHPSAKEYALWEPLIYEKVKKVLEEK
jgi:acyl-CoA thioesterase I